MTISPLSKAIHRLRDGLAAHDEAGLRDGQLVERFLADRDESAFASLVRRHGPMVLGVCGRILGNRHDAEDAFQATFLVLARKAGSVVPRDLVGHWLYGVAYRTALPARASARVVALSEGEITHMLLTKVKVFSWVLMVLLAAGAAVAQALRAENISAPEGARPPNKPQDGAGRGDARPGGEKRQAQLLPLP